MRIVIEFDEGEFTPDRFNSPIGADAYIETHDGSCANGKVVGYLGETES